MRTARSFLLALVLGTTLPAVGDNGVRRAPVLTEVSQHLQQAESELSQGHPELAIAHADMVLVGQPVAYRVEFDADVPVKVRPRCEKALKAALGAWERSLGATCAFTRVDSGEAPVTVRFKKDVLLGKEPVAGFANWKRAIRLDGVRVLSAKFSSLLQIRSLDLTGDPMPTDAMTHEVMHEMGHVLGLEDCDEVGQLMGPLDIENPVGRPLGHEIAAVRELREEAERVREEAVRQRG